MGLTKSKRERDGRFIQGFEKALIWRKEEAITRRKKKKNGKIKKIGDNKFKKGHRRPHINVGYYAL